MGRYWKMLVDVIVDPINLYKTLRNYPAPVFAVLVVVLSQLAFVLPVDVANVPRFDEIPANVIAVIQALGQGVAFLIFVGCLHGAARLLGGSGPLKSSVSALGMATAPGLLAAPLSVIVTLTGWSVVTAIGLPLLALWGFVLDVLAVREIYRLTTLRSVLSIPLGMFILLFIAFGTALLLALIFALASSIF